MNKAVDSDSALERAPAKTWAFLFALFAIIMIASTYAYRNIEFDYARTLQMQQLTSIGELKAKQILQWRRERISDAMRFSDSPLFEDAVHRLLAKPDDPALNHQVFERLELETMNSLYVNTMLLDQEGKLFFTIDPNDTTLDESTLKAISDSRQNKACVISRYHLSKQGRALIDVVAPITFSRNNARIGAFIVLRCSFENSLSSEIEFWPTRSQSAESYLVRRDSDSVTYLSRTLSHPNAAMRLRVSQKLTWLPEVQAINGTSGAIQTLDFDSTKVLADLRHIPESQWFLVTKIDESECLESANEKTSLVTFFIIVLIIIAGIAAFIAFRQRKTTIALAKAQAERSRIQTLEEFRTTLYSIGDGVITTDHKGNVKQMNGIACQLTGWREPEAVGRPVEDVYHIVDEDSRLPRINPVRSAIEQRRVVKPSGSNVLLSRDGAEYPISDSGAPIYDDNNELSGVVLIFRDQSELKHAERELRASELKFSTAFHQVPGPVVITRHEDAVFVEVNDAFERVTGYSRNEVVGKAINLWVDQEARDKVRAIIQEKGSVRDYLAEFQIKNGVRKFASYSASLIYLDGGPFVVNALHDMTDRIERDKQQNKYIERLGRLNVLASEFLLVDTLEEVYRKMYDELVHLFGECALVISEYSSETNMVRCVVAWRNQTSFDVSKLPPLELEPDGTGIQTRVIHERQPILTNDYEREIMQKVKAKYAIDKNGEQISEEDMKKSPDMIRSAIAVPIFDGQAVVGVMQVLHSQLGAFTEEDLHLVELMSHYAMSARKNTMLFTRLSREIVEKLRTEEMLSHSKGLYSGLFQNLQIGIYQTTLEGDLISANPYFLQITGFSSVEELQQRREQLSLRVLDYDRNWFKHELETKGVLIGIESRFRRKDGSIINIRENAHSVRDENGKVIYYEGTFEDVTRQVNAASELRLLYQGIDQVTETVMITDREGNVVYINPVFEQTTGYSKDEIIGQNPRILSSGKHDRLFYLELWNTISSGNVWRGRIINRRKNGKLYTEQMSIAPIRDVLGEISNYIAVKRDITRELELERELHHSLKMEAVGRLAGGVAHDFNNLLTVISGIVELLLMRLPQHSDIRPDLNSISDTVNRATMLTRQLLLFSRNQAYEPKDVNINKMLTEMQKMLSRLLNEDIALKLTMCHPDPFAHIDQGSAEQVIMNLVVNARDAISKNGAISISTRLIEFSDTQPPASGVLTEQFYVVIDVTDNGCGIPSELIDRVVEPFFTTKDAGKGTGLGLSMAHEIVRQMRGDLIISSVVGKGTTISIYLPQLLSPSEVKPMTKLEPELMGNELVVVVEDELNIRAVLKRLLEMNGYRCILFENGRTALEWLTGRKSGLPDVVLCDVVMPEMGGIDLLESIKKEYPELPFIMMSGHTTDERVIRCRDSGIPFLMKPFKTPHMLEEIRRVIKMRVLN